jgi:DNA-binding transcriptional LysR family regulator
MSAWPRTSLEHWAILAAVIDHGGFAQAATALHKSQSAVSYAIARLQGALDTPLLVVEGRKAVLTDHGRTLLKRVRPLLHDLHALESHALQLKQGWEPELSLVVEAAYPRQQLLEVVWEINELCPATQLQLSDAVLSGAEEAITDARADVVVTSRIPSGFLGDLLLEVTFVAVAAPAHPLFAIEVPLDGEYLERYVQIVLRDSGRTNPRDEGWLGAHRRFTVSSMEASCAMVLAGLGYAWLPLHMVEGAIANGSLKPLPLIAGRKRSVPLYLVLVRPDDAGPAARLAVQRFKARAVAELA